MTDDPRALAGRLRGPQQGRRVYPNEQGELWLAEGEYGRHPQTGKWLGRPPGFSTGSLAQHDVTEHEDGTITVSPSILITTYDNDCQIQWHGYLERGVWKRNRQ